MLLHVLLTIIVWNENSVGSTVGSDRCDRESHAKSHYLLSKLLRGFLNEGPKVFIAHQNP